MSKKNIVGKEEIACYEQILLFPTVVSKDLYGGHINTRACLERVRSMKNILEDNTLLCEQLKHQSLAKKGLQNPAKCKQKKIIGPGRINYKF